MSSEVAADDQYSGKVPAVLDTSWISTEHAVGASSGRRGGGIRGRDGKRRTRRRTLSPSIGKHNCMYNVDLNDPMNFPSLYSSGSGSLNKISSSSRSSRSPAKDVVEDSTPPSVLHTATSSSPSPGPQVNEEDTPVDNLAEALSSVPSSGGSGTSQDGDSPDPIVVADLLDLEETTPTQPAPGSLPAGLFDSLQNRNPVSTESSSLSAKSRLKREGLPPGETSQARVRPSSSPATVKSRGRSGRRATIGGTDTRIYLDSENLEPVLPSKPPPPSSIISSSSSAVTRATPSGITDEAVVAESQQRQVHTDTVPTTVLLDNQGEERASPRPQAAPPAAKQKGKSRTSRRRSIVMPSEATAFMDSELAARRAEGASAATAAASASNSSNGDEESTGEIATAASTTPAVVAGAGSEGKQQNRRNKSSGRSTSTSSGKKNVLVRQSLSSSINATSCLFQSLAAQRGWGVGDESTRKKLFRAYYAAAPDSQKARRVAARLFCLTGYALTAVAAGDAQVLCEAAGDSMDWGLDETAPRLVNRPIRRETKEQKRGLVMRIKPIFELMEKTSQEERLKAEEATGVIPRKSSTDGYRYEDRKTGEPVDPEAYKRPYLKHVGAVRASRADKFAAQARAASSTAVSASVTAAAPTPGAANASIREEDCASLEEVARSSAPISQAVAVEARRSRGHEKVTPTAPSVDSSASVPVSVAAVVEAPPANKEGPPEDISKIEFSSQDVPLENGIDAAGAIAVEQRYASEGDRGPEDESDLRGLGEAHHPEVHPGTRKSPIGLLPTVVVREGESTASLAPISSLAEILSTDSRRTAVGVGGAPKEDDVNANAQAEPETPKAVAAAMAVGGGHEDHGADDLKSIEKGLGKPSSFAGQKDEEAPWSRTPGAVCVDSQPMMAGESPRATGVAAATVNGEPISARQVGPDDGHGPCTATTASAFVSQVEEPQNELGHTASGDVSGGRGGCELRSPKFSEPPSPALLVAGGGSDPTSTSPGYAEPCNGDEQRDKDSPSTKPVDVQGDNASEAEDGGEVLEIASIPFSGGSSENDESKGGSDTAAVMGLAGPSLAAAAANAGTGAAGAVLPLDTTQGSDGRDQVGIEAFGGATLVPEGAGERACPSRHPTPLNALLKANSPGRSEVSTSPGVGEQGAAEMAALEERLWAAWDAAVREYQEGVALVQARYNRRDRPENISSSNATTPTRDISMTTCRYLAGGPAPPRVGTTCEGVISSAGPPLGLEKETSCSDSTAAVAASPADLAAATTPPVVSAEGVTGAAVAPPAAAAGVDSGGMPTPESPLLPLLQLRLAEEEEEDLFEYSSSWCGAGAGGDDGGAGGSTQARSGNNRRRSLARAFSSQKTRGAPKVQEVVVSTAAGKLPGSTGAGVQAIDKPDIGSGGSGSGSGGGSANAVCRLCCRKACDTVLHPCEHVACGVCVEKLKVQGKQLGRALSCPWDRQPVENVSPLSTCTK